MSKTVLVVDDSRMSRMMISTIIKSHQPDWNIIEAGGGEEALVNVKDKSIDVMTIDMNMPGMDGVTLGVELRALYPKAHIALVTANVQDAVRKKAESAQMIFVPKPITEDRIMEFINASA